MRQKNISRWEVVKNTRFMMMFAVIYTALTLVCLIGIIKKTPLSYQIIFIVSAIFLLMHFRRMFAYFCDILQLRIRVLEGKVRKLVFGVDYDSSSKPGDYDLYELLTTNGDILRFPCSHKVFNCDLVAEGKFVFLRSSFDLVRAEIFER